MLTKEILQKRRNHICGSDVAAIMNVSTYKSAYELYLEKRDTSEIEEQEQSELQYWGHRLEPVIRDEFAKRNNVVVTEPTMKVSSDYPFLAANVDGYIKETNEILEIKTANSFTAHMWGEEGTDQIPQHYLYQVAHYCAVFDAPRAHIAVLIGGNTYREYIYERDLVLESTLIEACKSFWDDVKSGLEPCLTRISDVKLKYPSSDEAKTVEASSSLIDTIDSLQQTKTAIKEHKVREDELKLEVMKQMEDAEILTDREGQKIATFKTGKRGRTLLLK